MFRSNHYNIYIAAVQIGLSKSRSCMNIFFSIASFFIWQDIYTKFWKCYCERQCYDLQIYRVGGPPLAYSYWQKYFIWQAIFTKFSIQNCSGRVIVAYSYDTNWSIRIEQKRLHTFLCYKNCTCQGYYSVGSVEVVAFSYCYLY